MKKIPERWMVVVAVLLGTFTVILNNSMLNPAVPHFEKVFHASSVSTSWIITVYMVGMGMTMPLTGYLSEKLGKRRLYMTGLVLFAIASILGAFAWSLGSVIFFRAMQGIAGGTMMPLSMALIFEVFPRHQRGAAMGVWGIAGMVAPALGPTVGGFIIEQFSWKFLFLSNVPVAILAFIFSFIYLKSPSRNPDRKFDTKGFIAVTIGVGSILYSLGRMQTVDQLTNPVNLALIAFGMICLIVFGLMERRTEQPLLNLSLFKTTAFSLSVWISSVGKIGLFTTIFLVPYLIQNVYGLSPVVTGFVLFPSAIFSGIFMNIGGRVLDKKGPLFVVPFGLAITTIMMLSLGIVGLHTSILAIAFLMILRGTGQGLTNMPATTTGMNSIPDKMVAQGSSMNNVVGQVGSAFAIAFVSIFFGVRKAAFIAAGDSARVASLHAINEAFLIIAALMILTIPAGILLGKKFEQQERKRLKSRKPSTV
jgi:EmrB/QacA subfamily drug resistance transporter